MYRDVMLNVLKDSVIGEYEANIDGDIHRAVLAKNGISEWYLEGKKTKEYKWKIVKEEIHIIYNFIIHVYRINKDQTITYIAYIRDEKRTDAPKDYRYTYKRIK